jgi:hypothetical protein
MQTKDQRIMQLAQEITELLHKHPSRHEACDALEIAKVLFRPVFAEKPEPLPVRPSTPQMLADQP